MPVTVALFLGAVAMGLAGVCLWAWGVRSGQFRDLEKTKDQIFWPELGPSGGDEGPAARNPEATGRSASR